MSDKRSGAYFDLRPLDDDLEVDLAQRMGKDWHVIGIRLGVGNELSSIEEDFHWQFRRAWEVLQSWKHYRGKDATEKELYTTLLRCERKDLADLLLKSDGKRGASTESTFRPRSTVLSRREGEHLRRNLKPLPDQFSSTFPLRKGMQVPVTSENRRSRDDSCLDQLRQTNEMQTTEFGAFLYSETDTDLFHAESLNIDLPGYFGKRLSQQQGTLKLLGKRDGAYLIRDPDHLRPEQTNHRHTLMLVVEGVISYIKIFGYRDGCVYADSLEHLRKRFRNLKEMISWHKTNKIKHFSSRGIVDVHLTEPVVD